MEELWPLPARMSSVEEERLKSEKQRAPRPALPTRSRPARLPGRAPSPVGPAATLATASSFCSSFPSAARTGRAWPEAPGTRRSQRCPGVAPSGAAPAGGGCGGTGAARAPFSPLQSPGRSVGRGTAAAAPLRHVSGMPTPRRPRNQNCGSFSTAQARVKKVIIIIK